MNDLSTLELGIGTWVKDAAPRLAAPTKAFFRSVVNSIMERNMRQWRYAAGNVRRYRLGEEVFHSAYGGGRVLAHWPDGRLLIAFDRSASNQLVFPSMLGCLQDQHKGSF